MLELVFAVAVQEVEQPLCEHLSAAASPNHPAELRRTALPPPAIAAVIIFIHFGTETLHILFTD